MVTSEGLIQVIKVNLRVPFMFSWCYHDFLSFWRFDLWKLACEWNAVLSPADPPFYRSCDKIFNQTNHNYLRGQSFTFNWTMCAKCRTRILVKFWLVFKVDHAKSTSVCLQVSCYSTYAHCIKWTNYVWEDWTSQENRSQFTHWRTWMNILSCFESLVAKHVPEFVSAA